MMQPKLQRPLGEFVHHEECRFCRKKDLATILDLGEVPLAGAFLRQEGFSTEKFYPLQVRFCRDCSLIQVGDAVPADVLFKNYFYFSSAIGTLVEHFRDFASELSERFAPPGRSLVVELGCNDGVFLKPLLARGIDCVGVDPATNVVQSSGFDGTRIVNDYFTERAARRILEERGPADAIVSSFSFAHIDDMHEVMRGIQALLKDGGVFIFEVYYVGIIVDEFQYDMIYHEHMSYYNLTCLMKFFDRFGMEIFEVKRIPLRAGTIRFYARKKGSSLEPVSASVGALLAYENDRKLNTLESYRDVAQSVEGTKVDLLALLDRLKREGKRVIGYGASGRATTIMNYCGIDASYLEYVVDDAPAKHGLFTPGTHVPIRPWTATLEDRPDYALVFAWSFIDEVKKRRQDYLQQGGRFIVPLPTVRTISA